MFATLFSNLFYVFCFLFRVAFFFYCYGDQQDLLSFPTRRSSDLPRRDRPAGREVGGAVAAGVDQAAVFDHAHGAAGAIDRKSTRLNSSHSQISYAVFCLKKKKYCVFFFFFGITAFLFFPSLFLTV